VALKGIDVFSYFKEGGPVKGLDAHSRAKMAA
jgi:hypothetical protein